MLFWSFVLAFVLFIAQLHTALIIIFSIVGVALVIAEGYVCGRICADLVHRKDPELNEVMWFWLGFIFSWVALLFTLIVKNRTE